MRSPRVRARLDRSRRARRRRRSARPTARRTRASRRPCRGGASRGSRRTAAPRAMSGHERAAIGSSSSVCWRTSAPTTSSPSRSSIASRPGDAVDVDERARLHAPELHQRHQALAAGEHAHVAAALEQRERLVDRRRARGRRTARPSCARRTSGSGSGSFALSRNSTVVKTMSAVPAFTRSWIIDSPSPNERAARLGDLVASARRRLAVAVAADRVAAADARPEVVEDVAVEGEALAGSEADLPDARALVLEQEPRADARVRRCASRARRGARATSPRNRRRRRSERVSSSWRADATPPRAIRTMTNPCTMR